MIMNDIDKGRAVLFNNMMLAECLYNLWKVVLRNVNTDERDCWYCLEFLWSCLYITSPSCAL